MLQIYHDHPYNECRFKTPLKIVNFPRKSGAIFKTHTERIVDLLRVFVVVVL